MATSFDVNDPMLTQALLTHFVQQVEFTASGFDQLSAAGMCPDLVDRLKSRVTVADLCRVAASNPSRFTVTFDDRSLLADFSRSEMVNRDDQIKDYLIRNGASFELLRKWFSLSRGDVTAYRSSLNSPSVSTGGRSKLPDVHTRDEIHRAWSAMPSTKLEREAYYELHSRFSEYTVAALYQVVNEADIPLPMPTRFTNTTSSTGKTTETSIAKPRIGAAPLIRETR